MRQLVARGSVAARLVWVILLVSCNPGGDVGDAGVDAAATCPTGPGTIHGSYIDADETWSADGNPHHVTGEIRVNGNATLTLGPCAMVVVDPGLGFYVGFQGATSKLVAQGTSDQPVVIMGSDTSSPWSHITVEQPGTASLTWTVLSGGGGDALRFGASVVVWGDAQLPLKKVLSAAHVAVLDSAGAGVLVERFGGFADGSTDLLVQGAGKSDAADGYALRVATPSVGTLPPGTFTGNAHDEIAVDGAQEINVADTFHGLGVPYHMLTDLKARPPNGTSPPAQLTIEAGAVVRFEKGQKMIVGSGSSVPSLVWPTNLVVSGTPSQPVVFTSAEPAPAPGDWVGIFFQGFTSTSSVQNARIEYAGADCLCSGWSCAQQQESAVHIEYTQPASAFIHDSTFAHIAGNGVMSGWTGSQVDFKSVNTFTDVSGCEQTLWQDPNIGCPTPNPQCF